MKKALITIGLVPMILALVLFVFPSKATAAPECEATSVGTICARLVGNDVVVTLLGQEIARIAAPVREVEVQVPVPGPTEIIPGPTEIIPGPTRTTTIPPIPGPTTTVTVPGSDSTSTATATVTLRPSGQSSEARVNIGPSATVSGGDIAPGSTPQAIETITSPPKTVVDEREKKVTVTIPQAIGISLGLLLLGLLLGLAAVYAAYAVGYKNSEEADLKEWRKFTNDLFGRGKHE
jgi:hypothetical protein